MQTKSEDFKNKINQIFGDVDERIFNTHYLNKPKSFRINTIRFDSESILKSLRETGFEVEKTEFPNAFLVVNESKDNRLSDTEESKSSQIYIQELSSMIPAIVLDPQPEEKILDLCAAPGSKTTQMCLLCNTSKITAVEENKSRFFKLKDILKSQGADRVECILADGVRLPFMRKDLESYFDKVLVDAPCTGENAINLNEKDALKFWRSSNAGRLSKLQKGLLNAAVKMTKPGGIIIYSTCTYSVEENEMVLDWILKRHENLSIEPTNFKLNNSRSGLTTWKERELNPQVQNALRVIPNEHYNAFFVAKLHKA